jgi:HAD superfamily hydrolase (TIGR01509 family)
MKREAGLIFDFDGVIVDSEKLQFRSYSQVLAEFGVEVSVSEYGREWIAAGLGPEYAVEKYGLPMGPDELRERKNPIYHRMLREEAELMPAVPETLAGLASRYALALATNSNRIDTGFVLDHFGLRDYFDAVITREDYRERKPAPDAFLKAAAAIGLAAGRCIVLEDAYKGVLAAHRAGCPCIAVPNEFTLDNDFGLAAAIVECLADVTPELIENMLEGQPELNRKPKFEIPDSKRAI